MLVGNKQNVCFCVCVKMDTETEKDKQTILKQTKTQGCNHNLLLIPVFLQQHGEAC